MKLPIRNYTGKPLALFIEVWCDEYEIPADGEAIVTLEDGPPHSIDVRDGMIVIWDEGRGHARADPAPVEIHRTMTSLRPPSVLSRSRWLRLGALIAVGSAALFLSCGGNISVAMPVLAGVAVVAIGMLVVWRIFGPPVSD